MTHHTSLIDDYIEQCVPELRERLYALKKTIMEAAPEATESFSYQMPTFVFHGNLVHFAVFKNHIGFYPAPSGISAYQEALSVYKWAKGSVQFPLNQPLPLDLIREIVAFRVAENLKLAEEKQLKKRKNKTGQEQEV